MVLKNILMAPEIKKVVINMGLGVDGNDNKILKSCEEDLGKIAGQKPVITNLKNLYLILKPEKTLMLD